MMCELWIMFHMNGNISLELCVSCEMGFGTLLMEHTNLCYANEDML